MVMASQTDLPGVVHRQLDGMGAASQAEVQQLQQGLAHAQAASQAAAAERDAALAEQEVHDSTCAWCPSIQALPYKP